MSIIQKLNWGLLGTAQINQKIIPLLQESPLSTLIGVASRDAQKAADYAQTWRIPHSYSSYDQIMNDPNVQVIYNSLPNHLHFEWSKIALQKGKHVLCEKPLTMNSNQILELKEIALHKNVLLTEGFMYRHHLQTIQIKELIQSEKLGRLKHIRTYFHSVLPLTDQLRLNPEVGGGIEWDIGCYLVNYIQYLVGNVPTDVKSWVRKGNTGVNEILTATLNFSQQVSANFECSFLGPRKENMDLFFENGWINIPRPFKPTTKEEISITINRVSETMTIEDPINPYEKEIRDFESAILSRKSPLISIDDSYETIRTIEHLLNS